MSCLIRSELLKLRTTRTFLGVVLAAVGLVALIVGLSSALAPAEELSAVEQLDTAGLAQPFALVLGILAVSTEFRHGTITPALLTVPDRARLVVAKLVAHVLAGLALGLTAYGVAAVLVAVVLPLRDVSGMSIGDGIEQVAGGVAAIALLATLGVGVGALVRNQVGAVIAGLAWLFVIEPLLVALPSVGGEIEEYGIGGAITAVSASTFGGGTDLGQIAGGLLLLAYAALFAIVGTVVLRRRDVSA